LQLTTENCSVNYRLKLYNVESDKKVQSVVNILPK